MSVKHTCPVAGVGEQLWSDRVIVVDECVVYPASWRGERTPQG